MKTGTDHFIPEAGWVVRASTELSTNGVVVRASTELSTNGFLPVRPERHTVTPSKGEGQSRSKLSTFRFPALLDQQVSEQDILHARMPDFCRQHATKVMVALVDALMKTVARTQQWERHGKNYSDE
jgi:hypothetical protein